MGDCKQKGKLIVIGDSSFPSTVGYWGGVSKRFPVPGNFRVNLYNETIVLNTVSLKDFSSTVMSCFFSLYFIVIFPPLPNIPELVLSKPNTINFFLNKKLFLGNIYLIVT